MQRNQSSSPIIFLIYINDNHFSIEDASLYLYADVLTLVVFDDNKHSLIKKVSENLNSIVQYCELNSLFISIKKTKAMFFFNSAKRLFLSNNEPKYRN